MSEMVQLRVTPRVELNVSVTSTNRQWVFGEALRIIPKQVGEPERPLVRRGRHSWYIRGAIRNGVEVEIITYGDGSCVGPFYLRAELRSSGSSFRVCRSPNFVFGVGTRATLEFETRRIDGILGLGLQTVGRMQNFANSLYHEDRIDVKCFFVYTILAGTRAPHDKGARACISQAGCSVATSAPLMCMVMAENSLTPKTSQTPRELKVSTRVTEKLSDSQVPESKLYYPDRVKGFTIALGKKDQRSYLIVGENTAGGVVRLRGECQSSWIQVLPSARQWEIRLESITIRETTIEVGRTVMLDSGTSYCYLPSPACDALDKALDGRPASNSSTHIYPPTQPSETIKFHFNGISVERGFSDMLDPRPNTTPDPNHGPSAKPIFKPAGALADLGTNREVCILGNFFLRGLVVEFDRTNHAPAGRIRMAARGNDG
ncbi:hypothetical protein B0H11DRAFT_2192943 [Mycena galericulata]|nr:hypothetical protein B0H11DRAFT_2192943 [Mycena galericulata]